MKRIMDGRQLLFRILKMDIDHRADDLGDFSYNRFHITLILI